MDQCSSADAGLQVNALIPGHHYLHTPGGPLIPGYHYLHTPGGPLIPGHNYLHTPGGPLIPGHHDLHTPGGPLQYSLEGHRFAPFGVAVTSDGQYIVSASTVFIIWDVTTGDVFRQVGPATKGGLIRHLVLTPDDQTAIAVTSNNDVRTLIIIAPLLLSAASLTPTHFSHSWQLYYHANNKNIFHRLVYVIIYVIGIIYVVISYSYATVQGNDSVFTALHYMQRDIGYRKPSARPSVKRVNCDKRKETYAHIL